MSSGVREPVAAGSLYSSDPQALRVEIDAAINNADSDFAGPKLLVLPEAGLSATPGVSGGALLMLESERDHIDTVVLISDFEPGIGDRSFAGVAVPRAVAFRTPLGDLLTDRDAIEALSSHNAVVLNDRPFLNNESIEVHLPPLQRLLGAVKIVPMLVGEALTDDIVDVIERVWGSRNTLLVVSTRMARGRDIDQVAEAGERARIALGRSEMAAGAAESVGAPRTLEAICLIANRRSMGLNELGACTIESPTRPDDYVEFAAFGAWESTDATLAEADVAHLRALALSAIHFTVLGGRVDGIDLGRVPPALVARRACVVTLRRDGQTRGSAGTIEADRSLAASVVRNASAACSDPRLPSVQPAELDALDLSISVVTPIERMFPKTWDQLASLVTPGDHGVLVSQADLRAAQLPAMWLKFATPERFIAAVVQKARLDPAMKVAEAAWYRFETIDY